MVSEGAKVVFGDILDHEGELLAKDVGDSCRYVALDVTKPEQWESAVATAVNEFGGIHVLVNNAGIINVGIAGGLRGIRMAADPRRQPDRGVSWVSAQSSSR